MRRATSNPHPYPRPVTRALTLTLTLTLTLSRSLATLLDRTNSGTPVLCLDVRKRADIRELAALGVGKLSISEIGKLEARCTDLHSVALRKAASTVPRETSEGASSSKSRLKRSDSERKLVTDSFTEVMTEAETKHRWREMVIGLAKAEIEKGMEELHKVGKCESLDCAALAFMNEALIVGESKERVQHHLFSAIEKAERHAEDRRRGVKEAIREETVLDDSGTRATAVQITDIANWFAHTFYANLFNSKVCTNRAHFYSTLNLNEPTIALTL